MCDFQIDILLATFNGARYLEGQLYSILAQSHRNWKVYIHDDGSNDNTLEILEYFCRIDRRFVVINDGVTGLGPAGNFMHLLQSSESEFICFADQDDIWFENKLSDLCSEIAKRDNRIPQLVVGGAYIWTDEGTISERQVNSMLKLSDMLFQNGGAQGCACIFNRALLEKIKVHIDYVAMHDHFLTMACIVFGELNYIDKKLFFYRRHNDNVTGYRRTLNQRFFERSAVVDSRYYRGVRAFYDKFEDVIGPEHKSEIKAYLGMVNRSYLARLTAILKNGFKLHNSMILLISKLTFCRYIK